MEFDDTSKTHGIGFNIGRIFVGLGFCATEFIFGVTWPDNLFIFHFGPFNLLFAKL